MMTTLQMENELLRKWRSLPDEKRQEALNFMQHLDSKTQQMSKPLRSALGICSHLNIAIDASDIDETRQELWSKFLGEEI